MSAARSAAEAIASSDKMAQLYALHAPGAIRLAYLTTGNKDLAEDLAQEAFVRLLGRFGDLRNPDAFQAYLRRTVVNLSKKHWRRRDVERRFSARAQELARNEVARMPDVETSDELWNALQSLPPRQRAAVVLRYYEDLSEDQTADVLQCSVGAVKSLVARATESLRQQRWTATP